MKKLLKLTLLAAALLSVNTMFAQKFGRINTQEVIFAMPEFKEMQTNLEAFGKDLQDQLEAIQVEFNTKYAEFQKVSPTLSDTVKQLKEKELTDLQNRYQEFQQIAQQDMQKKQGELFEPVHKKATDAINKVAQAGGYLTVFDTSTAGLAYYDATQLTDIAAQVRKELGITDTPAAAAPAAKK